MLKGYIIFVAIVSAVRGSTTTNGVLNSPLNAISEEIHKQNATVGANTSQGLEAARSAKSAEIRKYMNDSNDPCEQFFDFACGNWKTHHPIKKAQVQSRAFTMVLQEFDRKLHHLLNTVDAMDTPSERKVKQFFHSCTNVLEHRYLLSYTLRELVDEFGPMPVLVGDAWQVQTVVEFSYKYGIRIIFGYEIHPDENDHSSFVMSLLREEIEISKSVRRDRDNYKLLIMDYFYLQAEVAEQVAQEIVDFEALLWEASQNNTKPAEYTTVQQMYDKYSPGLDVRHLMNISYDSIPTGVVSDDNPDYVENLIDIMANTPKRVVADHISLRLLYLFDKDVRWTAIPDYNKGQCIDMIKKNFPQILSYMFHRSYRLQGTEQAFEGMWQYIKFTLQMIFESSGLNWFNDESREYALEKLHSMKMVVNSFEENNFDDDYGQLLVNSTNYMQNVAALKAFNAAKSRASLNGAPQYTQISTRLYSPNYVPLSNSINIPVSALNSDFFSSSLYPNAFNFAHIGFLISHEVLHGFSGQGRYFNKLGNFLEWWDADIEIEYAERRKCLHDQYQEYTFDGRNLRQEATQAENAADNGGILLAYEAYRRWYEDTERTKKELDEETLPNLDYKNRQLFFINYAQMWCADTQESMRSVFAARVRAHTIDEFRTFVPLTNIDDFAKEFKCPKGSAMNPVRKCRILE